MKTYIKNGRDLDGNQVFILIQDGLIESMSSQDFYELEAEDTQFDLLGHLVLPGFVDLHVHLREPGGEHKETIATGTAAAARGGFTTVCAMPNTQPVPDNIKVLDGILETIDQHALVHVLPYAAITQGLKGQVLSQDFAALKSHGAVAFTDDGVGIQTAGMMEAAMKAIHKFGGILVAHTEDNSLVHGGVVHLGNVSERLGLPGISNQTEAVQIARDVLLSQSTGCPYHVCHVSTKESVAIIRWAKSQGIQVTAEVSPHHLVLCEDDILTDDANFKMNPPLRSQEDRQALIEGLRDGTIDCIATDHAPHALEEKQQSMTSAPFGIIGSEIAFQLLFTHFVKTGIFDLADLVHWLTLSPSRIFGLSAGELKEGLPADIVVVDIDKEWTYDVTQSYSKSQNSPFDGHCLTSDIMMTLVDGQVAFEHPDSTITQR